MNKKLAVAISATAFISIMAFGNLVEPISPQKNSALMYAANNQPVSAFPLYQGKIKGDFLEIALNKSESKLLVDLSSIKKNEDGTRFAKVGSSIIKVVGSDSPTVSVLLKDATFDCKKKEVSVSGGTITSGKGSKIDTERFTTKDKKFVSVEGNDLATLELDLICFLPDSELEKLNTAEGKPLPKAKKPLGDNDT